MNESKIISIPPDSVKETYSDNDPIKMFINIPDGLEAVRQSFYLQFDLRYTTGANPVPLTAAQQVFFDNFAGSSCFIEGLNLKMGSSYTENNMLYYSEWNKLVNEVAYGCDELSNQTKHSLELRSGHYSQSKAFLRSSPDGWITVSHQLKNGLNKTNRNFGADDVGQIVWDWKFKDRKLAFYGASINVADSAVQYRNVKLVFTAQPKSQTGLLTMKTTTGKRYVIASNNAYFEYDLPIPTSSISSYFTTQALLNANSMSSTRPVIEQLIYTFNNSNMEKLSYTLDNDEEILMNFKRSLLGDVDSPVDSLTLSRLSNTTQSTYGTGLNFDGLQPVGKKVGVQLLSNASNINQYIMYTFFNGEVVLKDGPEPSVISKSLTVKAPLNWGQKGDSMQTYELMPKYHSATRSEWHIPSGYTILSDLRLVNLTTGVNNGILQYFTGLGGLVKNISLLADGKVLLSGINRGHSSRMYGLQNMLRSNNRNKYVQYELDGSRLGFDNLIDVDGIRCRDTEADLYRTISNGNKLGRVELKQYIPLLRQCDYLRFKELKLVVEWNTTGASVYTNATAGQALQIAQNPPTLLFDRITPDRPLSQCVFWDIEIQTLVAPAAPQNEKKPVNFDLQNLNGRTINRMLVINDIGPNNFIGNAMSHAMRDEKYIFSDDKKELFIPSELTGDDMRRMMVEKYGSMNLPLNLDKYQLLNDAAAQGDNSLSAGILNYLHTQSWKCLPFGGIKPKRLQLQYTRTGVNVAAGSPQMNIIFATEVLKAITFDGEGKAVVSSL